ncbi:hypothetical protein Hdeb2414_s0008g00293021 [Helianthus debilis subsp. tardiflorus]
MAENRSNSGGLIRVLVQSRVILQLCFGSDYCSIRFSDSEKGSSGSVHLFGS